MGESVVGSHPELAPLPVDRSKRSRLLEAMVRAVAEKGYEAASVADAVRLARVSLGTFYELFSSKEACLQAAYRAGYEVLEQRIREAVREASDWREELRLGFRAYLKTLEQDPLFARVYLIEAHVVAAEREQVMERFAARYARTFAKSGRPVPPQEALFILAVGVHEVACARVRKGQGVLDLEPLLVSCAVRLATDQEDPWT